MEKKLNEAVDTVRDWATHGAPQQPEWVKQFWAIVEKLGRGSHIDFSLEVQDFIRKEKAASYEEGKKSKEIWCGCGDEIDPIEDKPLCQSCKMVETWKFKAASVKETVEKCVEIIRVGIGANQGQLREELVKQVRALLTRIENGV